MKQYHKTVKTMAAIFVLAAFLAMTGCAEKESAALQEDTEVGQEMLGEENESGEDQQGNPEVQTAVDEAQEQDTVQAQDGGTGSTIALNTSRKTAAEWEEEDRARRAGFEEKVKAADGISEAEAVEIARKAMETDLGDRSKGLKLIVDETYGWSSELCIADWSEIKEEDKGAIAYSVGFNNVEIGKEMDIEDLINYVCVVNAVDGSILEAYMIPGMDEAVYYEHKAF